MKNYLYYLLLLFIAFPPKTLIVDDEKLKSQEIGSLLGNELKDFYLSYADIKDIDFLRYFDNLGKLQLKYSKIESLVVLKRFTKTLEYIEVVDCPVKDWSVLGTLENLKYLNLQSVPLKNQKHLNLRLTKIYPDTLPYFQLNVLKPKGTSY